MIGIDTNVLLRYITRDEPKQTRKVLALFETFTESHPGYVSAITLAELCWVLRTVYKASRAQIEQIVERLLASRELQLEHASVVKCAVDAYRQGKADFPDYLILLCNLVAGCTHTVTFDRTAAKAAGMKLL